MTLPAPGDIPIWVMGCVGFWLLGCIWIGWRRGVVRQAVAILALVGAWVAAFTLGPLLAPMVPPLGFPVFVRPIVAGMIIGLVIWLCVTIASMILFKKTSEQGFGLIRLFYGGFGAVLGLVFGLTVLALAAWGIHMSGCFAEGIQHSSSAKRRKIQSGETSSILSFKRILDQTNISNLLSKVDPVDASFYPRLEKAGQLLASPEAVDRLFAAPEMQAVVKNPKVAALREDPKIQEYLKTGDLLGLMRSPKVRAAASDTQLLTTLKVVNLEHQVDLALGPKEKALPPGSP